MNWLKKIVGWRPRVQSSDNYGDAASNSAATSAEEKISPFKPPSIPKEWLIEKIPHEDIVSGAIYQRKFTLSIRHLDVIPMMENPRYWMLPRSATDGEDWIRLQRSLQHGDEVWTFSSTTSGGKSPWHRAGVCLVRQGEIIDSVSEELHLHIRR